MPDVEIAQYKLQYPSISAQKSRQSGNLTRLTSSHIQNYSPRTLFDVVTSKDTVGPGAGNNLETGSPRNPQGANSGDVGGDISLKLNADDISKIK